MEKQNPQKMEPKKVKVLNTSSLPVNQENALRLVGSIVEKGIDDGDSQKKTNNFYSFPKPTVVPFPVARHRSHGPHWHPLNSKGGYDHGNGDSDNDIEDEEDAAFMGFEKVAAFANPIQRRKTKGLDFGKWKQITQDDKSSFGRDLENDVTASSQTTRKKKNAHGDKITDKKISTYSDGSVFESMEMDLKPQLDESDGIFINSATSMELDTSNKVDNHKKVDHAITYNDKKEEEFAAERNQVFPDRMTDHSSTSQKNYFIHDQEPTSLESEIDSENQARIQQMSAEEIAEAKADIMEKISPSLLKVLQKRGKEKLKKSNSFKSEVGTVAESVNQQVQNTQGKRLQTEDGISHTVVVPPSKKQLDDKNVSGKTSTTTGSSSWNAWSERVEAVRELRFSLAGDVVDTEQEPVYDSIRERDYLRTEGDPGAAGYTIKEALSLTRSVVPGQRALALHLLSSVLDKALCYICKERTGNMTKKGNRVDKSVDWEAVWTYALGPQPELALSLRICLDDNHNSVVLACAKAVQSALSCDVNENYFDISETDPSASLEEYIVSILIAIVRHSPSCANAVLRCERLVQTIVQRFTVGNFEIRSSMIKSVKLLKVLARLDRKICLEFIKNGYFNAMTWNLYQLPLSIDDWLKLGKEKSKLKSALTIEQLRFWMVCIRYGYCVSYFSQIFPALCFWLDVPSFEKLIKNNVLYESTCISREAYLVLESLAGRLPNLFTQQCLTNQHPESTDEAEVWSWSYVAPMVDLGIKWIATRSDPEVSKLFQGQEKGRTDFTLGGDLSATPLLWVYAAVAQMLFRVLERVALGDAISLEKSNGHVPWLPEFVPKIGLELITYWHLGFSVAFGTKCGIDSGDDESFMKELMHLRQTGDIEMSLASTCCLNGMINIITKIDDLIRSAKTGICSSPSEEQSRSKEEKVLKEGIVSRCLVELRPMLDVFMFSASSGWQHMQAIEMFGRGGPAPGVGVGWGARGGGFWSKTVLSAQTDARFLVYLLEIFVNASKEVPETEETTLTMQRVNTALGLCLTAGSRDMVVVEKALDLLFHVSTLKYLDLCIQNFLLKKRGKAFTWQYEEDDYMHFSWILSSHFRSRWLSIRVKSKAVDGSSSSGNRATPKEDARLDTIYEDSDMTSLTSPCCSSLMIEWARQNLPLPVHFYLSPISTIPLTKRAGRQKVGSVHNTHDPANLLEVAKCGLFFVLGIETMSNYQGTDIPSPIHHVTLTWKLHSLSVNFLVGMEIIEQDQGRETFEALQDLYGEVLDKERLNRNKEVISDDKKHIEFLRFKSEIHESYSIFIEDLVEQFSSISYGDLIFGRQVSLYLHRCVETSIRLATWNTLSNARVLELLPSLEKCFSGAEGYLEPAEDNEEILEAYAKSWVSDALDRAAIRGSITYTIAVHHLSSFIFNACPVDKILLRNKLARSLLRDYSGKQQHEGMVMNLIHHNKLSTSDMDEKRWLESRVNILIEACEGNSSLLRQVEKLKDAAEKSSL
ncbi:hypothetical protein KIW84_023888 [Lathyrus oleraceus]|uniref:Uncharacterized protein n=1 Tax=Pisum sativum TaxID=3888 RepID=A0A9D4YG57_PEA|nr:hypothetical protein KIW84_023888 [Pisum sativum]